MSNLYTPPAPSLIEVCERFLRDYSQATYPAMRDALAREKKRQVFVDAVIAEARKYVRQWGDSTFAVYLVESVKALDAFGKEGK